MVSPSPTVDVIVMVMLPGAFLLFFSMAGHVVYSGTPGINKVLWIAILFMGAFLGALLYYFLIFLRAQGRQSALSA